MKQPHAAPFSHAQPERIGVLLCNLGSPAAPTPTALRRYLAEFLWDRRVVDVPRPLWWLILHGIILRLRPRRSARLYQKIWRAEGSPLVHFTQRQAQGLSAALAARWQNQIAVHWAMRYGEPNIAQTLERMQQEGVRKLLVVPLYPQYSATTSASTFDALARDFASRRWLPALRFVNAYCDFEPYLQALAASIRTYWQAHPQPEKLIFSYHGIPLRYFHAGDPYHCQCLATSRRVAEILGLAEDRYLTTFQSRFGREPWLQPYTAASLQALASEGVRRVQVVCPGFAADCLETLEEIDMENRALFIAGGGEDYAYIPALNDSAEHIDALAQLVESQLQGWLVNTEQGLAQRAQRAASHPFNSYPGDHD